PRLRRARRCGQGLSLAPFRAGALRRRGQLQGQRPRSRVGQERAVLEPVESPEDRRATQLQRGPAEDLARRGTALRRDDHRQLARRRRRRRADVLGRGHRSGEDREMSRRPAALTATACGTVAAAGQPAPACPDCVEATFWEISPTYWNDAVAATTPELSAL